MHDCDWSIAQESPTEVPLSKREAKVRAKLTRLVCIIAIVRTLIVSVEKRSSPPPPFINANGARKGEYAARYPWRWEMSTETLPNSNSRNIVYILCSWDINEPPSPPSCSVVAAWCAYTGKKNLLNQENWRSRVTNCICCRLNTIRTWMNYSTWEQRHGIYLIEYNAHLTTWAGGHPQPPNCLTQQTFFFGVRCTLSSESEPPTIIPPKKKRVSERVSPGIMHIFRSETFGGLLARIFAPKSLTESLESGYMHDSQRDSLRDSFFLRGIGV